MATVLIVEDERTTRKVLALGIKNLGYRVMEAESGEEALSMLLGVDSDIDMILMDVVMPGMDGIETTGRIRSMEIPAVIIMLTSDDSSETIKRAVMAGADDYMTKPVDPNQLATRLELALKASSFYVYRHNFASQIEGFESFHAEDRKSMDIIASKNENLLSDLLKTLNLIAKMRDNDTYEHTSRVGWLSMALAKTMGEPEDEVLSLGLAAPLHDIGKIGVPDSILLKPGSLTDREWEIMKQHPIFGWKLLSRFSSGVLMTAASVALNHHERWDGSGYPKGLKGEEIPLYGRIVAVADSFDAMVSPRPYKEAKPVDWGFEEIRSLAGIQFCPETVKAFISLEEKIEKRYEMEKQAQI